MNILSLISALSLIISSINHTIMDRIRGLETYSLTLHKSAYCWFDPGTDPWLTVTKTMDAILAPMKETLTYFWNFYLYLSSKASSSELICSKLIPFEFHAFLCNAHFLEFHALFALKKRASEQQWWKNIKDLNFRFIWY